MAKTGRIAYCAEPKKPFVIDERELPTPKPGTIVIKTELCGVCATDVHVWMGWNDLANNEKNFPVICGHEFCGTVELMGEGVSKDYLGRPLKKGDRVAVKPMYQCGQCYYCSGINLRVKCENAEAYGDTSYHDPWFIGGYGEYVYVFYPESEIFKIDAQPEVAVLLEPLSIAVRCMNFSKQKIGDAVVVQGAGPIGLLTAMCAKYYGASKVIMVGGPKERLKIAKEVGVDEVFDIADSKPEERIKIIRDLCNNGKGADVVYECAGFPSAFEEGIEYVRFGGTYCEAGHYVDSGKTATINPATAVCARHATIVGVWASQTEDFVQAVKVMESKRMPLEKLITHKIPLERIYDTFQACSTNYILDGKEIVKAAVDPWGSPWEK